MEKIIIICIVLLTVFLKTQAALIYYPELPVDRKTLIKAQIALDNWKRNLDNTYATNKESPRKIRKDTDLVVGQLQELAKQLAAYNNVVLGGSNGVVGSKNLIIGNRNSVYGNNNFIFS